MKIKLFTVNPLGENTYIVHDETAEAVIIDCGAFFEKEKQAIEEYLTDNHLHLVTHLLTHTHFDHCLGARFIYDHYGLEPRCSAEDQPLYEHIDEQARSMTGDILRAEKTPVGEAITADSIITFGNHKFTVIPCPGHTPGGLCFYCAEEKVLFSGDSLFHMSIGRTDFVGGNHWQLISALKQLLKNLPDDVTIYPGHGPSTNVLFERTNNPYLP